MSNETHVKITVDLADKAAQKALEGFASRGDKADRVMQKFGKTTGSVFVDVSSHIGKSIGVFDIFTGNLAANVATKAFDSLVGGAKALYQNLILDTEEANRLNAQFAALTENAGVSGSALKEAFLGAAGGMIDDTKLIKSANEALIELGDFANDLPSLFNLAKKATVQFGGEVTQNFDSMVSAIASGSTKTLKQFGLFIDAEKAQKDFAKSLGVTADQLNETGKRQALLNAVMAKGNEAFKTVDTSALQNTTALKKLGAAFSEAADLAGSFVNRLFGAAAAKATGSFASAILDLTSLLKGAFGTEQQKAQVKLDQTRKSIEFYTKAVQEQAAFLEKNRAHLVQSGQIGKVQKGYDDLKAKLDSLTASQNAQTESSEKAASTDTKNTNIIAKNKNYLLNEDIKASSVRKQFAEQTLKDAQSAKDVYASQLEIVRANATEELAILEQKNARKLVLGQDYFAARQTIDEERFASEQALATERFLQENQLLAEARKEGELTERQYYEARDFLAEKFASDQAKRDADQKKAEKDLTTEREKENKKRAENLQSTFAYISTLQQSSVKELFFIGKAAALATAYIDAQSAIMKALSAAPPPFNFALAAAVGAASAVNIAKIATSKPPAFQDGGVVGGFVGASSGPDNTLVQARRGEMYLNASQQKRLFDIADGGGNANALGQLASAISALANQNIVVSVDGKAIFEATRNQLNAGRSF